VISRRLMPRERERALELLAATALRGGELDSFVKNALDVAYWRRLNPQLSIDETSITHVGEANPLGAKDIERLAAKLVDEGYFRSEPVLAPAQVRRLTDAVERLRATGWPAAFSLVYDQFWALFRTPSVAQLLTRLLGTGYKQNSNVWTYYIPLAAGSAGWPPHVDSGDGTSRITIWIPLTDATLANGCIYTVPRSGVPESLPSDFRRWESIRANELRHLLQAARAVPAPAGSLLGWTHQLIHWGSVSTPENTAPRISVAMEFVSAGVEVTTDETPMLDWLPLPGYSQRLFVIGKALLKYTHFEPLMTRYSEMAKQLINASSQIVASECV
jgi:hypothetical protein